MLRYQCVLKFEIRNEMLLILQKKIGNNLVLFVRQYLAKLINSQLRKLDIGFRVVLILKFKTSNGFMPLHTSSLPIPVQIPSQLGNLLLYSVE